MCYMVWLFFLTPGSTTIRPSRRSIIKIDTRYEPQDEFHLKWTVVLFKMLKLESLGQVTTFFYSDLFDLVGQKNHNY